MKLKFTNWNHFSLNCINLLSVLSLAFAVNCLLCSCAKINGIDDVDTELIHVNGVDFKSPVSCHRIDEMHERYLVAIYNISQQVEKNGWVHFDALIVCTLKGEMKFGDKVSFDRFYDGKIPSENYFKGAIFCLNYSPPSINDSTRGNLSYIDPQSPYSFYKVNKALELDRLKRTKVKLNKSP